MSDQTQVASATVLVEVSSEPLQLVKYTTFVADNGAGAIATFIGVTRDNFLGKVVQKLEYEAYGPMAEKLMEGICKEAAVKWSIKKMALAHKSGSCGVGEASVIIAASSAHRRDALEAVHWAIDELKASVPIWKKEFFEGGEVWKENAESRRAQLQQDLRPA